MSGPACTVVLNTYNRAAVLPRAVRSVLDQTFADFELLVVDDGSTDHTAAVMAAFDDSRIRYVPQRNAGLSAARNTGIGEAAGRFVVFLDDDDRVVPTWLERLTAAFDDEQCGIACCGLTLVGPGGEVVETVLPSGMGAAWEHVDGLFLSGSFAVQRRLLTDAGGYEPAMPCSHQTELSLRLVPACLQRGLCVVPIREALLIVERRAPTDRPMRDSRRLITGASILVERHGERLRRSPEVLAYYLAIAGVNSARIGDYAGARRFLRQAIRINPTFPKNYARLAAAMVPPLGDRLWRAGQYRKAAAA